MTPGQRSDLIGRVGELRFADQVGGAHFEPVMLGAKWPLFDYLIEVRPATGEAAFAFVSVRSTEAGFNARGRLRVRWEPAELAAMATHPAPTYLAGVDVRADGGGVFLLSANGEADRMASLPTDYPLDAANLSRLRGELVDFWSDRPAALHSRFRPPEAP